MTNTQNKQTIEKLWPHFTEAVKARLEVGAREYGDASFHRPEPQLLHEIEEELLDVMGWTFILYCRIHKAEEVLRGHQINASHAL